MRKRLKALCLLLAIAIAATPLTAFAAAGEWTKSSKHSYEVRLDSPDGGTFRQGSTIEIKFSMKNNSTKGTTVSAHLATDNWGRYATAKSNAVQSVNSLSLANGVKSFSIKVPSNAAAGSYRLWVEVADKGFSSESGPQMFTYLTITSSSTNTTASPVNDWRQVSGYWYYYNSSGSAVTGWRQISSNWYYFDSSGRMKTGWLKNGSWYYLDSSGKMKTGWLSEGGSWYYFGSSGTMVTGWRQIGGEWYYFNSTGKMVTGWLQLSGSWYYFNSSGKMLTGNVTISGERHRFSTSGVWLGVN